MVTDVDLGSTTEPQPKTCHSEEEETEDQDRSQLGALLLQVGTLITCLQNVRLTLSYYYRLCALSFIFYV